MNKILGFIAILSAIQLQVLGVPNNCSDYYLLISETVFGHEPLFLDEVDLGLLDPAIPRSCYLQLHCDLVTTECQKNVDAATNIGSHIDIPDPSTIIKHDAAGTSIAPRPPATETPKYSTTTDNITANITSTIKYTYTTNSTVTVTEAPSVTTTKTVTDSTTNATTLAVTKATTVNTTVNTTTPAVTKTSTDNSTVAETEAPSISTMKTVTDALTTATTLVVTKATTVNTTDALTEAPIVPTKETVTDAPKTATTPAVTKASTVTTTVAVTEAPSIPTKKTVTDTSTIDSTHVTESGFKNIKPDSPVKSRYSIKTALLSFLKNKSETDIILIIVLVAIGLLAMNMLCYIAMRKVDGSRPISGKYDISPYE